MSNNHNKQHQLIIWKYLEFHKWAYSTSYKMHILYMGHKARSNASAKHFRQTWHVHICTCLQFNFTKSTISMEKYCKSKYVITRNMLSTLHIIIVKVLPYWLQCSDIIESPTASSLSTRLSGLCLKQLSGGQKRMDNTQNERDRSPSQQ